MNVIPTTANEQTLDAVNSMNVKNLGDMNPFSAGLSAQNALAQQQRVNEIANANVQLALQSAQQLSQLAGQQALNIAASQAQLQQAITGRVARFMLDISAEESVGFAKEVSADLSSKLADIGGQLAALQEQAKIAQTTPPETGQTGQNALLAQLASIQALLQSLAERKTP